MKSFGEEGAQLNAGSSHVSNSNLKSNLMMNTQKSPPQGPYFESSYVQQQIQSPHKQDYSGELHEPRTDNYLQQQGMRRLSKQSLTNLLQKQFDQKEPAVSNAGSGSDQKIKHLLSEEQEASSKEYESLDAVEKNAESFGQHEVRAVLNEIVQQICNELEGHADHFADTDPQLHSSLHHEQKSVAAQNQDKFKKQQSVESSMLNHPLSQKQATDSNVPTDQFAPSLVQLQTDHAHSIASQNKQQPADGHLVTGQAQEQLVPEKRESGQGQVQLQADGCVGTCLRFSAWIDPLDDVWAQLSREKRVAGAHSRRASLLGSGSAASEGDFASHFVSAFNKKAHLLRLPHNLYFSLDWRRTFTLQVRGVMLKLVGDSLQILIDVRYQHMYGCLKFYIAGFDAGQLQLFPFAEAFQVQAALDQLLKIFILRESAGLAEADKLDNYWNVSDKCGELSDAVLL